MNLFPLSVICAANINRVIAQQIQKYPIQYDEFISGLSFLARAKWEQLNRDMMKWKSIGQKNHIIVGLEKHPNGKTMIKASFIEVVQPFYYSVKKVYRNKKQYPAILIHISAGTNVALAVIYKFVYISIRDKTLNIKDIIDKINSIKIISENSLEAMFS